jgi:hypothetical protein
LEEAFQIDVDRIAVHAGRSNEVGEVSPSCGDLTAMPRGAANPKTAASLKARHFRNMASVKLRDALFVFEHFCAVSQWTALACRTCHFGAPSIDT